MTAMTAESPSRLIAAEVRAEMARRGISARALSLKLGGVSYMWVTRRIGVNADQELTFEDLDRIAAALGVPASKLIQDSHWLPRLDSNQQPSGYAVADEPLFDLAA
jgi:transcriptional regulator with XRE-family HTH domain